VKRYISIKIGVIFFSLFFFVINSHGFGKVKTDKTYKVGYQELTFYDSSRGRTLKTIFWYPISDNKTLEINPHGKPYPLILFSHGHRSNNIQSFSLMQEWASHGFIVAAPNHEKNTMADFDEKYQGMMQFARSIDLRFIVDRILELNKDSKSFLCKMVDPESMGISGHSFGGHTTLMTAGATPNLDHLADYCSSQYNDWDICPLQDEIQKLYPGKRIINESDPRMKAALALAPDGYGWFLKDGMARIKIPIMIMSGEMDTVCTLKAEQRPMYEGINSKKYLVILKKADHVAFCDCCGDSATVEQIANITSAFWMIYLKNDKQAGSYLSKYVSSQRDINMLMRVSD
jgi:predicted dienelactone hydrolase